MASCVTTPTGQLCPEPSTWATCRPWDLTQENRTTCYIDAVQQQALDIAGAQVNVYRLLGVHEQGRLVDLTGDGNPISGGDWTGFPAINAFRTTLSEWRSKQSGSSNIITSAYIGYDFGHIKISTGRQRYGIDASVRYHITTIKIKQSSKANMRVTKVRVERSENGRDWYGVAIVTLPNDDVLNKVSFKHSVSNRYWRLRPLEFTGEHCDSWGVQALELHDYMATNINNIEDKILMENRNRDYSSMVITLKGYYELQIPVLDLTPYGGSMGEISYQIKVNFNSCVGLLTRPVVVGDIIELPSETQYTPDLRPIKRYLEVTDVTWDSTSYTPGWQPTMLLVTAKPALASQETQDIFGDLAKKVDSSGLFSGDDGNNTKYQDFTGITQAIQQEAKTDVPEAGSEGSNVIREFSDEEIEAGKAGGVDNINKIGFNRVGAYVEDAIPQNNAPYTEGPDWPLNPVNGDYHRLVYLGLARDVPAKLFRYSTKKGRWIYQETDRRAQFNNQQAILTEYMVSPTRKPAREIK